MLWDSFRTLYRLLTKVRRNVPELIPSRFHVRKVKKLHLFVTRYAKSPSAKRRRKVKKCQVRYLEQVERIHAVASDFVHSMKHVPDIGALALVEEIASFLPTIRTVINVARRAWIGAEVVPAAQRVFSLFEPHTELIKRGRRAKPVEFGHAIWLAQSRSRFITQYAVMERKIPDSELADPILASHEAIFGKPPETLVADKGFRPKREKMNACRERVKVVAIPSG